MKLKKVQGLQIQFEIFTIRFINGEIGTFENWTKYHTLTCQIGLMATIYWS